MSTDTNTSTAPQPWDFAITIDNVSVKAPCPLCGQDGRHNEQTGEGIYVKQRPSGWSMPVCDACARQHAPRLLAIMEAWREKQLAEAEAEA